jgi:hypothetical protein
MPIFDSIPPIANPVFPAASEITAFGFVSSYYYKIDPFTGDFVPESQNYYTFGSFTEDPSAMIDLGISESTFLNRKYYPTSDVVPATGLNAVTLRYVYPLDTNKATFATLLREDDVFVRNISKNTFLLSSLGVSLSTLTGSSGFTGSAAARLSSISTHTPTTTATLLSMIPSDRAFVAGLVDRLDNKAGVSVGSITTPTELTVGQQQVAYRTVKAFHTMFQNSLTAAPVALGAWPGNANVFHGLYYTDFAKTIAGALPLSSNSYINYDSATNPAKQAIVSLTESKELINRAVALRFVLQADVGTLPITSIYDSIDYATQVTNTAFSDSNPASSYGIHNVFFNNFSYIKNITSINIESNKINVLSGGLSSVDVSATNLLYNLSANSLSAGTLTYNKLTRVGPNGIEIPAEYLPLSGGIMTGAVFFSNSSRLDQGRQDTSRGGSSGISLVCSADYDLNWQAGWLQSLEQDRTTNRPLYIDSGAGTTVRVWSGIANNTDGKGTEISHTGLTASTGLFNINLSTASLSADSGVFNISLSTAKLTADTGIFNTSLSTTNLSATSTTLHNLSVTNNISASTLNVTNLSTTGTFFYTTLQKIDANGNNVPGGINNDGLSCTNLTATNALITNLTATSGLFQTSISSASITGVEGVYAKKFYTIGSDGVPTEFVGGGTSTSITDPLTITGISCTNLTATNALITNLTALNLSSVNLTSTNLSSVNLSASVLTFTTLQQIKPDGTVVDVTTNIGTGGGGTVSDPLSIGGVSCINLTAANSVVSNLTSNAITIEGTFGADIAIGVVSANILSATTLSAADLYCAGSASLPSLTSTDIQIEINKPINSTDNIITTGDVSATNLYGNIRGNIFTVGLSNELIYLSAQRADINYLSAGDVNVVTYTINVTSLSTNNDTGETSIITTPTTIGGNLSSINIFSNQNRSILLSADNTQTNFLTSYNSISLVSALDEFTSATVFYASTAGKVGVNTSAPTTELAVVGTISASNSIISQSITSNSIISLSDITYSNTLSTLTGNFSTLSGSIYGTINNSADIKTSLFNKLSTTSLSSVSITSNSLSASQITSNLITTDTGNSNLWTSAYYTPVTINLILDGMGSSVKAGVRGRVEIPFNMNISAWSLYADTANITNTTSITTVSTTYENYPEVAPLHLDSSYIPKLGLGSIKNTDNVTETEWNINLKQGDIIQFGLLQEIQGDGSPVPVSATHITLAIKGSRCQ